MSDDVERAKIESAKHMIQTDGLRKARRLVRQDKRDGEALVRALEELADDVHNEL